MALAQHPLDREATDLTQFLAPLHLMVAVGRDQLIVVEEAELTEELAVLAVVVVVEEQPVERGIRPAHHRLKVIMVEMANQEALLEVVAAAGQVKLVKMHRLLPVETVATELRLLYLVLLLITLVVVVGGLRVGVMV